MWECENCGCLMDSSHVEDLLVWDQDIECQECGSYLVVPHQ